MSGEVEEVKETEGQEEEDGRSGFFDGCEHVFVDYRLAKIEVRIV